MTVLELGPLADAAAGYQQALARLEDAAAQAEAAWQLLPAALDSPGTQLAVGSWVGPAHRLTSGLADAATALHSTLLSAAADLRRLSAQAGTEPDDPSWAVRLEGAEDGWASAIRSIHGGEAGSVSLPCITPSRTAPSGPIPAAFLVPTAPVGSFFPALDELLGTATAAGAALGEATAATTAAASAGLIGTLGLVLSLGGSTDVSEPAPTRLSRRRPRPGEPVRITPYQPCNPLEHGPGCLQGEFPVDKPGDEPFTGDKVRGDEEPGDMPGTEKDWVKSRSDNDQGWVYKSPDGRTLRVMEPKWDARYPNGYVEFKIPETPQPRNLDLRPEGGADATHIVRNPDGSFPIPKGWNE